MIQILLIMFPHNLDTYPWSLNKTSGLLMVLNLVFRPDVLLFSFIVPNRLYVTGVLMVPFLVYIFFACLLMRKAYNVSELEFIRVKTDQRSYGLLGLLNIFVFRILYVPMLANCASAINLKTGNMEILGQFIGGLMFLVVTNFAVYDKTYKTTCNWFDKSFESMARLDTIRRL